MVGLSDALLVYKFELRHNCTELELSVTVEVRNVAYNEVITVEGNRIALFDQTQDVIVMID